jgi:biopolymer transport protein ExbD
MAAISGNRKSATFIDMTPMVDLAFLLLTFFVLTTSLFKPQVMPIAMPEKVNDPIDQPPVEGKRVLTLVLGKSDEIYWYLGTSNEKAERTNFSANGIRRLLNKKKTEIENMVVLIKPSDQSQYKNVVDILDEMIITVINKYAIVDMEPADEELIRNGV